VAVRDQESRPAVAAALFLGFAASFAVALLESREALIISRFILRWEFARAASLFAVWMPPLLFAACAASMSMQQERGRRFAQLLRPVLAPALILALLFSAFELTVLPGIRRTQKSYESLSRLFQDALEEAEEALQARDIPRAQERIALCGAIDSREIEYKILNEKIQKAFLETERASESLKTPPPPAAAASDSGSSAYEFYRKAQGYYRQGDYYSAHWYAGKALLLDASRRDARLLQAEAWEKITSSAENPADKARADFYSSKARGYALLQSGDYLGAYRVFTDLSRVNPKDPDVIRYKKESLDRLSETSFFADDYRRAFASAGVDDFAVRIVRGDIYHILYASKVASAGPFLYFEEFEYLQADPGGPILHIRAPYARLREVPPLGAGGNEKNGEGITSVVSLRRVERNSPREVTQPQYVLGESSPPGRAVIEIPMRFEDLSVLLDLRDETRRIPFLQLMSGSKIAERYGWDPSPYRLETALRISIPVFLVILVLLGTAIGARFRRDEEPGQLRMILALPLLTLLASVPLNAANHAGQYLLAKLYAALPPAGAIAAWTGFLAALLTVSLLAVGRLGVHAPD